MAEHMGAREARAKLSEVMGRVHYGGETIILENSGKPMAAVIPLETYERMVAERDARFAVLDRIRAKLPAVPADEVEADVAEALAHVRRGRAPRRP